MSTVLLVAINAWIGGVMCVCLWQYAALRKEARTPEHVSARDARDDGWVL